jgi:hypothetical protein
MKKTNNTKEVKTKKDLTGLRRAVYIVAFASMLSITAYFGIMVDTPDKTQLVLGGLAGLSAVHYFILAIK